MPRAAVVVLAPCRESNAVIAVDGTCGGALIGIWRNSADDTARAYSAATWTSMTQVPPAFTAAMADASDAA